MEKIYNFSAGPSTLPAEVLKASQSEFLSVRGSGMSVTEITHRSSLFSDILGEAEKDLRELMNIPEDYAVLFLQGGATSQFSMIPLNLMKKDKADYVITGHFAKKAAEEAARYGKINIAASSEDKGYSYIPEKFSFNEDSDYCHITVNNTIYGTSYKTFPDTGKVTLVGDVSSIILSEPIDVSRFGLLYAGAQKNLGIAGLTVVILKKSLAGSPKEFTPDYFNYAKHIKAGSAYNTTPVFAVYMTGLVLKWLKSMGGVEGINKINKEKAKLLYDTLDASNFYIPSAQKSSRSLMNVTFRLPDEALTERFISEAKAIGLVNIKGHRQAGGIRASIYNAMPIEGVRALSAFMKDFEIKNA